MKIMSLYKTKDGRALLANLDLTYAMDQTDTVQRELLDPKHIKKLVCDVPAHLGLLCAHAYALTQRQKQLRPNYTFQLCATAKEAAAAHARCLEIGNLPQDSELRRYTNIYAVSTGGYALSQHDLSYATTSTSAAIQLACVTKEHSASTCYFNNRDLLTLISQYCKGIFLPADSTSCAPADYCHNWASYKRIDDKCVCMIRDGANTSLTTSQLADISAPERTLAIRQATFQLNLCRLHLAVSQASSM